MSPYSFTQAGTTYDAEDWLTGFARAATSGAPQLSQSWNLSAVGDWNSVTTNGTVQSRTHGPTHELLTAGGQGVTHQYDALGRRVARTASNATTVFVQVDQQTICDYVSGAAPASSTYRYLYASYIDEPIVRVTTSNSETTWYHRNQQYSIVACTDSTGAATERYAYTAYGLPTITDGSGTVRTSSAIGNHYTYTGREWDGVLGLYHYRARMYEATVGRFCSRDPIGYVDGKNLQMAYFAYSATDPFGQHIQILVTKGKEKASEGPCGGKGKVSKSWQFRLSKNHKTKGWLIQQVIVACAIGTCTDSLTLRTTCGSETHPATCKTDDDFDLFVYYEAWRVGFDQQEPEIPEDPTEDPHDTQPDITDKSSYLIPNASNNSCGSIVQYGVLKYFSEGTVGNLDNDPRWQPRPYRSYGRLPSCVTTAGHLRTYSGQGAPAAWLSTPLATGWRMSDFSWKCCKSDFKKNQRGKVTGLPN